MEQGEKHEKAGASQKKAPGRPARDPAQELKKVLMQWPTIVDNSDDSEFKLWFGEHRANQARYLDRTKKTFDAFLKSLDDESTVKEHMPQKKMLECIVQIVSAFNKCGGQYCKAFPKALAETLAETRKYMATPPACTLKMPMPVSRLAVEGELEGLGARSPKEFWPLVSLERLKSAGLASPEARQK